YPRTWATHPSHREPHQFFPFSDGKPIVVARPPQSARQQGNPSHRNLSRGASPSHRRPHRVRTAPVPRTSPPPTPPPPTSPPPPQPIRRPPETAWPAASRDQPPSASTARLVSSSTRSALITAPASAPPAADAPTWANGSVTFPAAHTPGTSVRPAGSAGMCTPIPLGCSLGFSPRSARNPARAVIRAPTATACRGTT